MEGGSNDDLKRSQQRTRMGSMGNACYFAVLSVIFLSGHGSGLIAGYNTTSKNEKSKYDAKKLCRVAGGGMTVITIFLFVVSVWEDVLPAAAAYFFLALIIVDCVVMIVLMNTVCKK